MYAILQQHSDDILRKMAGDQKDLRWMLYMPTPVEDFLPNPKIGPVKLPGVTFGDLGVVAQFGWDRFRGRLFGFGMYDGKAPYNSRNLQFFRMDYHQAHGGVIGTGHNRWYREVDSGKYDFHFHVPDRIEMPS